MYKLFFSSVGICIQQKLPYLVLLFPLLLLTLADFQMILSYLVQTSLLTLHLSTHIKKIVPYLCRFIKILLYLEQIIYCLTLYIHCIAWPCTTELLNWYWWILARVGCKNARACECGILKPTSANIHQYQFNNSFII